MVFYEYRVVPFIGQLRKGFFSSDNASKVSEQLQKLINEQASVGWEFCQVNAVNIFVKPGCMASMFGVKANLITFDQVIFRRPKEG
jgi:hypothetical protein